MAASSSGFAELLTSPQGQVLRQLYASYLTSAVQRSGQYGIPDTSYAVIKDWNTYELVRRDPVLFALIESRKHAVASSRWSVTPGGKAPQDEVCANVVSELLEQCENFDAARLNLAEADFRGSAFAKIEGTRKHLSVAGLPPRPWWVPTRILDIDRRRVRRRLDPPQGRPERVILEIADPYDGGKWREVESGQRPWLIEHVYDDAEISLGHGRGLLDALVHLLYGKTQVYAEGLQGFERWAQGLITVAVDPERAASTARTNDDLVQEAIEVISRSRARHVIAHMKGDEINVFPGPTGGHQMVMEWLSYFDNAAARLILGSVLPSGGDTGTGSLARADVEESSTKSLLHFSRVTLEATLNRSLIDLVFRLNRPNLLLMGLRMAQRPKLSLAPDPVPDPSAIVERASTMNTVGLPLSKAQLYDMTGFVPPTTPEDEIKAAAPSMGLGGLFGEPPPRPGQPPASPDAGTGNLSRDLAQERSDPAEAPKGA